MPAMLDDPTAATIYRVSGDAPYAAPGYNPLPEDITFKQVTLRDRITIATLVPFSSPEQVPPKLAACLCDLLNQEIELGNTYPMMEPIALSAFTPYWFGNFGAVMIMGDAESHGDLLNMEARGVDWTRQCLGSFYVKPNYPGRSSHVCNGGFLVTDSARNRGVGRLMGECYLDWAPKLGYTYSVFNLVYETNVASLRIWDALGFKRIGRVKGCGNLKSYPDQLIDAIIFGRELGIDSDEDDREQRFDKIFYYLKTGTYPQGADRAEKSRLRSAATHYRIVSAETGNEADDKLMLKGKEVVGDPHRQYEIARNEHVRTHGGINKTTASIAEKYHWVRIKETVSAAIRNCTECKEPSAGAGGGSKSTPAAKERRGTKNGDARAGASPVGISDQSPSRRNDAHQSHVVAGADMPDINPPSQHQQVAPIAQMASALDGYSEMPVDPQIMQQWQAEHGMQVDGDGYGGVEGLATDEDRLRAELEANMLQDHAYQTAHQRRPISISALQHLPGWLVPPTVFLGLLATLWLYKALVTVIFQEKIIYMPYMPPFTRSERVEEYAGVCKPVWWRKVEVRGRDGVRVWICVGRVQNGGEEGEGDVGVDGADGREDMAGKEDGKGKKVVICYFHGNGGSLPPRLPMLSNVLKAVVAQQSTLSPDAKVDFTLAALSYRGYWTSSGKPTQPGIELDAQALLQWVNDNYTTTPSAADTATDTIAETNNTQLILWGQSIGAGVASTAAAAYVHSTTSSPDRIPLTGLVLETPFASIKSMLLTIYPQTWLPYRYLWPFLRSHWDSDVALRRLSQITEKPAVLLLPASKDEIVPAGEAEKLEAVCRELGLEVERRDVKGALHVEATTRREGREAVAGFVVRVVNAGGKG